jgi:DNA-binding response OmpR family regulator
LTTVAAENPFIVLIDDDAHSADLLTRMLAAHGAPEIHHYASADAGMTELNTILSDVTNIWPGLVVVDLKANSKANSKFLTRNHAALRQKGIPIAVMTAPTDRAGRQKLQEAGASAVFFRQAALDAYRHEAASIVSFWARSLCLDAVGM